MIFDTTYTDKEVTKSINSRVGLPFSLWERLKLGGIGSHRIQVASISDNLKEYINPGLSVNNINIELRRSGIIIHFKRRTQTYGWVIPFTSLHQENFYQTISDGTYTINLRNPILHNASFFQKLEGLRQVV